MKQNLIKTRNWMEDMELNEASRAEKESFCKNKSAERF